MKRLLITAVAMTALLALPALASAGQNKENYVGSFDSLETAAKLPPEASIGFRYLSRSGKIFVVKGFKITNWTIDCNSGRTKTVKFKIKKMKVKSNKFKGTSKSGKKKFIVKGKFIKKGAAAKGTVKAKGKFGSAKCNTGKIKWRAVRGGISA